MKNYYNKDKIIIYKYGETPCIHKLKATTRNESDMPV